MKLQHTFRVALCGAFFVGASGAWAQQSNPQAGAPIPAYQSDYGSDTNGPMTVQPLSSVENLTPGLELTRSYWQPRADVDGSADSNPVEAPGEKNWQTWTSFSAGLDLHHATGRSDTTLSYQGGGVFSTGSGNAQAGVNNGIVQSLSFDQKYAFRLTTFSVVEQASYLPQSSFGYSGLGGVSLPTGAGGLQFGPGQSLLTGWGQNLDETTIVEMDRELSRRSAVTLSGGYSILHYFDSALFNYGEVNARAGYNYQVSPRNTFAVNYTFSDYLYSSQGGSLQSHTAQVSFARVIKGELAMQASAGPEEVASNTTALTPGGIGTGSYSHLLWSAQAALTYRKQRYGLNLNYNHGVSGGSGVLVGATSDVVSGGVTRQMSRTFSSGLTGGYSRSSGLPGAGAVSNQLYDYWFGNLTLTKPITETLGLNVSYQVNYQTSNSVFCVGPTCGGNVLRQMVSVGLGWHERPLLF